MLDSTWPKCVCHCLLPPRHIDRMDLKYGAVATHINTPVYNVSVQARMQPITPQCLLLYVSLARIPKIKLPMLSTCPPFMQRLSPIFQWQSSGFSFVNHSSTLPMNAFAFLQTEVFLSVLVILKQMEYLEPNPSFLSAVSTPSPRISH